MSTRSDPLAGFLEAARATVDAALERWLPAPPACPPLISEAVRYSVFAGGKRLRPVLTLAAADAVARLAPAGSPGRGGMSAAAGATAIDTGVLAAACAVELIHTYSLIHDDLPAMDNDTLRRGRPTLHVVYGDGIAILAGDALQAQAFAMLAGPEAVGDATRRLRAVAIVADAAGAIGMVGGQAIDLQAAGQVAGHTLALDADGLRAMHARKTGALIRASAVAGAVMAGAAPAAEAAVGRWADEVGLAFQIVDDILDVEGDAGELGKTAGKDAAGDKPTYPSFFGLDGSRRMAAACVERARGHLDAAGLRDGHLGAIADWVVGRRH